VISRAGSRQECVNPYHCEQPAVNGAHYEALAVSKPTNPMTVRGSKRPAHPRANVSSPTAVVIATGFIPYTLLIQGA
jgi:hypothetical protein